jgi:hypothetical protein
LRNKKPHRGNDGGISIYNNDEKIRVQKYQWQYQKSDSNINILNSVFYSLITSIVYSLGYHPSIGFLHGHTRRGGLVFDIADIFKHELYLKNIDLLNSDKNVTREFSLLMQNGKNKIIKNIIEQIEYILSGVI